MTASAAFLSLVCSLLNNRVASLYSSNRHGGHYRQLYAQEQRRLFSHSSLNVGDSPVKASAITLSLIIYEIPGKLSIGLHKIGCFSA